MPTYEYKCDACGHKFEKFQSIKSSPTRKCPHCGKSRVKRLIGTGAGLIFKGGGFYITDYRSEAYKSDAKADKSASAPAKESASKESTTGGSSTSDSTSKKNTGDAKPAAPAKAASDAKPVSSSSPAKGAKREK
jgi:putative FmdB family regulatory protein